MAALDSKRPYRKRKRAESEEETRRRITEAAVELHGTVGPARTKVTQVAKRAGVSRMTVYNHFPTDADLFAACSNHWASRNPFPDPSGWADVRNPRTRVAHALDELYGWYRRKQGMLENILRDAPIVESLGALMDDLWEGYIEEVVSTLADGWPTDREPEEGVRSVLRVVVDFNTWRILTTSGLNDSAAADLAVNMVLGAVLDDRSASLASPTDAAAPLRFR